MLNLFVSFLISWLLVTADCKALVTAFLCAFLSKCGEPSDLVPDSLTQTFVIGFAPPCSYDVCHFLTLPPLALKFHPKMPLG